MSTIALAMEGLPGNLVDRLGAIADAGFDAIEIDLQDLSRAGNLKTTLKALRQSPLNIVAAKGLRDFTGHVGHVLDYRMNLARESINLMNELECPLLIAQPSALNKTVHVSELVSQLSALANLAMLRGVNIAYRPLCWSDHAYDIVSAWHLIEQAGNRNLGLVFDSFQSLTDLDSAHSLERVPADRIWSLRLSGFRASALHVLEDKIDVDRHQRYFPRAENLSRELVRVISQLVISSNSCQTVISGNVESYRMQGLESTLESAQSSREEMNKILFE
ncbi:MAG: sugar phosphate isomerase/epimerase family protein [Oceanobacter sp.]